MTESALAGIRGEQFARGSARLELMLLRVCLVPAMRRIRLCLMCAAVVVQVTFGLRFQQVFTCQSAPSPSPLVTTHTRTHTYTLHRYTPVERPKLTRLGARESDGVEMPEIVVIAPHLPFCRTAHHKSLAHVSVGSLNS